MASRICPAGRSFNFETDLFGSLIAASEALTGVPATGERGFPLWISCEPQARHFLSTCDEWLAV